MSVFVLADNQDITRAGLIHLLSESVSKVPVCEVYNKKELVDALSGNPDAIVVLDYTLFDFSNVEELFIVSARFKNVRWLLFSEELSISFLRRIRSEDPFSILLKTCSLDEINSAFRDVQDLQRFICRQVSLILSTLTSDRDTEQLLLTVTEKEILKLIALGKSVKEIAEERCSSVHTIITHKKNIFRKIEVNNVHEATKYALKAGLIDEMEYYI